MARLPAYVLLAALSGLPAGVQALGLGDINLRSALNQPLDAEIEIVGASPAELRDLRAAVASRDTFSRYGLEYPQFLGKLRFKVERDAGGQDVLRVSSSQPVTEPFLTFLIEADWDRGRLLREYTVLLDPPVFMPAPAAAPVAVAPPRSAAAQPAPGAGTISRPVAAPPPREPEPEPVRPAVVREPVAAPPPAPAPRASEYAGASEYGPIQRGETLWAIANRMRPDAVTVNQMMVALFRANPEAFLSNINLLKQGSTLRIPSAQEIAGIARGEAVAEVQRQTELWRGAAAPEASTERTAAAESPEAARLRLVPPVEAGATPGTASSDAALAEARRTIDQQRTETATLRDEVSGLRQDLEETQRLIQLKDAELAALQQQLSDQRAAAEAAQAEVAESGAGEAGVDLETGEPVEPAFVADIEPPVDEPVAEVEGTDAVADTVDTEAPAGAGEPEATAEQVPAPATTTPAAATGGTSFMDRATAVIAKAGGWFKSTWIWMIALGLSSLLAAAFIALRGRRESVEAVETLEALAQEEGAAALDSEALTDLQGEKTAVMDEPSLGETVVETQAVESGVFEETGSFRPVDFDTVIQKPGEGQEYPFEDTAGSSGALEQADPLSEADFHMAYGLYDQAADLIKKALERDPERRDLQVKLLEIFFVWGNKDEFLQHARKLQASLVASPDNEWDKIVIMGKQICPGDALFAGAAGASVAAQGAVDLDLEASGDAPTPLDLGTAEPSGEPDSVDLDLGGALTANSDVQDATSTGVGSAPSLDLEFTGRSPVLPEQETTEIAHDEELNAIARKLEKRMGISERSDSDTDILDLGQTIAPEDVSLTGTLAEASPDDDDEVFGDFFAFTGVAEDEKKGGASKDRSLETSEQMLPDVSPTSELKIELPVDEGLDLELGDMSDDPTDAVPTVEDPLLKADTAELAPPDIGGETRTVSARDMVDDGDAVTQEITAESPMLSPVDGTARTVHRPILPDESLTKTVKVASPMGPKAGDSEAKTVKAPMLGPGSSADLLGGRDQTVSADTLDLDVGDADDEPEQHQTTVRVPASELALPENEEGALDEVGTKLDLARAYIDMGDPEGARSILAEVLEEGDESQRNDAQGLLRSLAS